jgi:anti-sigma-K factor RskA
MRLPDPQLIDRLAAEFVLGTLAGPARRRFARWVHADERVAGAVRRWEDRLAPLAADVRPLTPPSYLWQGILQRTVDAATRSAATGREGPGLGSADTGAPLQISVAAAPRESPRRGRGWRAYALAASVALLAVGAGLFYQERTSGAPWQQAAELRTPATTAVAWRIEFDAARHELRAAAEQPLPPPPDGAHELWALGADAAAPPVSLGLLPEAGRRVVRLTPAQLAALAAATRLAVSEEPPTGSPTGLPTGKVVLVAPRAALRFSS